MKKLNFSHEQTSRASEIFGNLAVAWFSAGVISPLFVRPKTIFEFMVTFSLSLVMTVLFFIWSLYLMRSKR